MNQKVPGDCHAHLKSSTSLSLEFFFALKISDPRRLVPSSTLHVLCPVRLFKPRVASDSGYLTNASRSPRSWLTGPTGIVPPPAAWWHRSATMKAKTHPRIEQCIELPAVTNSSLICFSMETRHRVWGWHWENIASMEELNHYVTWWITLAKFIHIYLDSSFVRRIIGFPELVRAKNIGTIEVNMTGRCYACFSFSPLSGGAAVKHLPTPWSIATLDWLYLLYLMMGSVV